MEADVARQLGKKLYLFVCSEDFPYDDAPPEGEDLQALQRAYRAEISKSKTVRTEVADREEVGRKVRELQFELEKLKGTIAHAGGGWSRYWLHYWSCSAASGAGIYGWLPSVIKHIHEISFDRGKAREQLVGTSDTGAKNIAAAGEDWRQVNEIEKWRDQQLSDLDRFLERIDQTFKRAKRVRAIAKPLICWQPKALMKPWLIWKHAALSASRLSKRKPAGAIRRRPSSQTAPGGTARRLTARDEVPV
jgi:hypothetical protein